MTISTSIGTTDEILILECSANIETHLELPTPAFEWFFGLRNSSIIVTDILMLDVMNNSNAHTSTLQVSRAGLYTCRLGGNERLAASTRLQSKCMYGCINDIWLSIYILGA